MKQIIKLLNKYTQQKNIKQPSPSNCYLTSLSLFCKILRSKNLLNADMKMYCKHKMSVYKGVHLQGQLYKKQPSKKNYINNYCLS